MARSVVAITGASSGLGEVFARKLGPEHDLLLIARRGDRLEALASELKEAYGCRVEVLVADLTLDDDLARVSDVIANDERLVLLVNNAGFGTKGLFWEVPFQSQEEMHRLHVMATLRLTRAALGNMVPKNRGGIINVASVAAFVRNVGAVSYAATKSWVTVFTEGLYLELKSTNSDVVIQALCPGFTYSEFHDTMGADRKRLAPAQFWMRPEDVVDASLAGLALRKLFVIPGWRYRLLTAVLSKLPSAFRVKTEVLFGYGRSRQIQSEAQGRRLPKS